MKISKALKEKKKLITEISRIKSRFTSENSIILGTKRKYETKEQLELLNIKITDLINLKAAINKASEPIYAIILEIAELKAKIATYNQLSVREGIERNSWSENDDQTEYIVEFDKIWVDEKIVETEGKIEKLQEDIDTFNHTTDI